MFQKRQRVHCIVTVPESEVGELRQLKTEAETALESYKAAQKVYGEANHRLVNSMRRIARAQSGLPENAFISANATTDCTGLFVTKFLEADGTPQLEISEGESDFADEEVEA